MFTAPGLSLDVMVLGTLQQLSFEVNQPGNPTFEGDGATLEAELRVGLSGWI